MQRLLTAQNPWALQQHQAYNSNEAIFEEEDDLLDETEAMWAALDEAIDAMPDEDDNLASFLAWADACESTAGGISTEILCPMCGISFLHMRDGVVHCECSFSMQLPDECHSAENLRGALEEAVEAHRASGCSRAPNFKLSSTLGSARVLLLQCHDCEACRVVL